MDFTKNIFNRLIEVAKKKFLQISFCLLFILLLFIYYPSFFYPPRSDHWTAFYFFHKVEGIKSFLKWKEVLIYDPIINTTFRPLNFLILYLGHLGFSSNYSLGQLTNFGLYLISILLVYKLAINFCQDRVLVVAFISVFACFFSHFDLICWSYQYLIILSFCSFLSGFLLYIHYLKSSRKVLLVLIGITFLSGMLLYEVFLFWPLAIIILNYINGTVNKDGHKKRQPLLPCLLVIVFTYAIYIALFLIDRGLRANYRSTISLDPLFSLSSIIANIFLVFFNVLYNNFFINLVPQLAYPLKIDENLNMGGIIARSGIPIDIIIFVGGGLMILAFLLIFTYLFNKKQFSAINKFTFLAFLLFSELFVLFHLKSLVNINVYNLTQFRFEYIPNAIFTIIVLFLIDIFLKPLKIKRAIIYGILCLVLFLNILAIKQGISILNLHLLPLQNILYGIKAGIHEGLINENDKIYIDGDLPDYLPNLCWNTYMGTRFISNGTYQWMFSRKETRYFANGLEEAVWVIDKKNLSVVAKTQHDMSGELAKINKMEGRGYIEIGKDKRYVDLGWGYVNQHDYQQAERIYKKAIEINPASYMAYTDLGHLYNIQHDYPQAERMFKRAIEINPNHASACHGLGNYYMAQHDYPQAERMFKRAIEINPRADWVYTDLGHLYNSQHDYQQAERMFKRAIEINPKNNRASVALKQLYKSKRNIKSP